MVSLSIWSVAMAAAFWLDMGQLRTLGLGNISLRTLDILERLLGVVSVFAVSTAAKLVAAGTGSFRVDRFKLLLVPDAL